MIPKILEQVQRMKMKLIKAPDEFLEKQVKEFDSKHYGSHEISQKYD